ncbi:MAG: class I SAM-dependent methyltransferase [Desulfomonilia bacterium]
MNYRKAVVSLSQPKLIMNYTAENFVKEYVENGARILNAGSSSVRFGSNCVNVDIQDGSGVDVVCDIHDIPDTLGRFDIIICTAVLQYCENPQKAVSEMYRVLRPGGYIYADVPWVQQYCPCAPDRFRFSEQAVREMFSRFEIVKLAPSVRPGTAWVFLGCAIMQDLTRNRYINFALALLFKAMLYPFKWIKTAEESKLAGGFYVVGKKL